MELYGLTETSNGKRVKIQIFRGNFKTRLIANMSEAFQIIKTQVTRTFTLSLNLHFTLLKNWKIQKVV